MASRRPLPRALSAMWSASLGLLPLLFLVGFSGVVFSSELSGGPIFYGRDTTTFYYPLTLWVSEELKAGRLPLWTPLIFGGYPIFADGEIGLLSPFQVLLLATLEMPFAYSAGRAIAFAIAALGLYCYARTLGANALGGTIGALGFTYGSFMVGHIQHDNILRSTIWLPWLLLAAEHALRAKGPRRLGWLALAALMLAFEGVGVHVQPVLISLLIFGLALLFGPFGRTSIPTIQSPGVSGAAALGRLVYDFKLLLARKRIANTSLDWFVGRVVLGVAIVGLGLGMAAAQLVPLYQLGLRSLRPGLVSYDFATSFAVSPPQILTLVLPALFNFDAERHWALWAPHETTLYVGIAPLLLAVLALAFVRGRAVTFYALVVLISLILVFGDYLPVKTYTVIWSLPGFSFLRAPARFNLLLTFGLAVLASLGLTWLMLRARYRGLSRPLGAVLGGMLLFPIVLGLALGAVRWWLRFDPARAVDLFSAAIHTSKENWLLGGWHVYYGLVEATRPDNPRTALGLGLLLITPVLLRLWLVRPRFQFVWGGLLMLLTAFDLWVFSTSFYFQAHVEHLFPSTPALTYVQQQPRPTRTFVEPTLNERFGANQLATLGIETVNGYSSLEPPRFSDYWWSVVHQDNFLLDLLDARYVLAARQVPGTRTYQGAVYHPDDRLMSGTAANPSGTETFRTAPIQATAVTVVAAVDGLGEAPTGTTVAEVTLIGSNGSRQTLPVRAGLEIAEYRSPESGWPMADYIGPPVIWTGPEHLPMQVKPGEPVRLYGAIIPLAQPVETVAVEVRMLWGVGRLHLHGLGVQGADTTGLSVRAFDKIKYRPIYADQTTVLLENTAARPRLFVVGEVLPANGPTTSARLHELTWDPSRQAIVEGLSADAMAQGGGAGPVGEVRLLEYLPERIVAQAELPAPGYVVLADRFDEGWRAYVDDVEVPLARANGVERLVAVPAGSHTVRFSYAPLPLYLGAGISAVAVLAWLGVLVAGPVLAVRARRRGARAAS